MTDFYSQFIRILDKNKQITPLHLNTPQTLFHQNKTGKDVILKARQMGMSTYILAYCYALAITSTQSIAIISHEDKSTQRFRRIIDRFYRLHHIGLSDYLDVDITDMSSEELDKFKSDMLPKRNYSNSVLTSFPEFDSEIEVFTGGSANTGRSGSYSLIHASEVAFWSEPEMIVAGLLQGGNPKIFMESTPNGASGFFYDLCMEIYNGERNDYKLHFYPWYYDNTYRIIEPLDTPYTDDELRLVTEIGLDDYQIAWRRTKQKETKGFFLQEYPEDIETCFLSSGNAYFGDVANAFTLLPNQAYNSDFRYYAGLDFAQTKDYTVLSIICRDTKTQVDMLRVNKLSWGEMRHRILLMCKKWNVTKLVAEKNSMGSSQIEELRKEFHDADMRVVIVPFQTTNTSKQEILSDLYEAIHEGGYRFLNNPKQKREFQVFTAKQTSLGGYKYEAPNNEHDDCVIANALCLSGILSAKVLAY